MKLALTVLIGLLPITTFAQLNPVPARFLGPIEEEISSTNIGEASRFSPLDMDKHLETENRGVLKKIMGAVNELPYAIFIEDERSTEITRVEPILFSDSFSVTTEGGIHGYVLSSQQDRPDMMPVNFWEVRVYSGQELIATETSVPAESMQFTRGSGQSARLSLASGVAKKLLSQARAFRDDKGRSRTIYNHLRIHLMPVEWQKLKRQPRNSQALDLTPDIRGIYKITHARLPTHHPISLSADQSLTLLGLKPRGKLDYCFAWLTGE